MRFGEIGRYLSSLIIWQIEPRLGFDPKLLSPIKSLAQAEDSVFIIAGTEDRPQL